MSENISINNPVEIKDNSKERVAFDLAMRIASVEGLVDDEKEYRKELLRLYGQCLATTTGGFRHVDFGKMI